MSLAPITRSSLAKFYDKYPYTPLPPELAELTARVQGLCSKLTSTKPDPPFPSPYRLDDCFWRNRQLCEETIDNLARVLDMCEEDRVGEVCLKVWDRLKLCEEQIKCVQKENTEQISGEVKKFLPKDFRTKMIEKRSYKQEAKRQKELEKLISKGATITEKYELMLSHQADRRKGLVELGECKGMFRWLIRHVAGVPKVLLDFAKEINAKLGPMEEQRERFGPYFYDVSELGTEIWALSYIWAKEYPLSKSQTTEILSLLQKVVNLYCQELERIALFIGKLFKVSPWFVSASDIKPITVDAVSGPIKCELDDHPSDSDSESGPSDH